VKVSACGRSPDRNRSGFFTDGEKLPPALAVHLLVPGRASAFSEFEARLGSLASIQPFSWNEGCVLDGLLDLAELPGREQFRQTAQQHLALFIQNGRLVYEDPKSVPADGRVYGIEGVLPFAALVRLDPQHPLLELPVKFALKHRDASGAGRDGHSTTSEGTYTVGYPSRCWRRHAGRRNWPCLRWPSSASARRGCSTARSSIARAKRAARAATAIGRAASPGSCSAWPGRWPSYASAMTSKTS